jgi:hypothetical protein
VLSVRTLLPIPHRMVTGGMVPPNLTPADPHMMRTAALKAPP